MQSLVLDSIGLIELYMIIVLGIVLVVVLSKDEQEQKQPVQYQYPATVFILRVVLGPQLGVGVGDADGELLGPFDDLPSDA